MTLCKLEDCSARMSSELSDLIRTGLTKQIERNGTKWLILKVILELCCTFVIGHISSEMQPTIPLEMPVPSQGHCGFPSFSVVDWFCLFVDLWVLPFRLEDCSVFGNFVITLMQHHKNKLYIVMFRKKNKNKQTNKQTNKQKHLKDNKWYHQISMSYFTLSIVLDDNQMDHQ